MKPTTLAVAVSALASAGLAAVAAYDMALWNGARAREAEMRKSPPILHSRATGSMRQPTGTGP